MPPPKTTHETAAAVLKRLNQPAGTATGPAEDAHSLNHCRLMAPMSEDARLQHLRASGCDDNAVWLIAQATAQSTGKPVPANLGEDIRSLIGRWPSPERLQLLHARLNGLNDDQARLAKAYAACWIYEKAATALYLAIVDHMPPVDTQEASKPGIMARDQAIADAGFHDEVSRRPK